MKDVMLDFEALGKGPGKCVCQVGAIYFDNITGELGNQFNANIDPESHEFYGGKLDANTVLWWLKQSEQARNAVFSDPKNIVTVFEGLNQFLAPAKRIWSHATFDFVTLLETMKQLSIKPAFSSKSSMDLRTLVYLGGRGTTVDAAREGIHHDALDDCKHQVKYCVRALNVIKTNKRLIQFANSLGEE